MNCGAQFNLPRIAGESWTQVASQLDVPNSTVAQEIDGAANTLITAICKVVGGQPSSVCGQSYAMITLGVRPAARWTSRQDTRTWRWLAKTYPIPLAELCTFATSGHERERERSRCGRGSLWGLNGVDVAHPRRDDNVPFNTILAARGT